MEPLTIVLRGQGGGLSGSGGGGGYLTNVQCNPFKKCHNEFPLHNEYILVKMRRKKAWLFLFKKIN
jgi:hypothetical protein